MWADLEAGYLPVVSHAHLLEASLAEELLGARYLGEFLGRDLLPLESCPAN